MTVDEQDLRDLADELRHLYRELDALKYAPPAPRETRVMKPRPDCLTPIPGTKMDLTPRRHAGGREA